MSLSDIRPYYRTTLEGLDFHEHPDGFNIDNIPSTQYDKAFHLTAGSFDQVDQDQESTDITQSQGVQLFFRGFNDPIGAIDDSYEEIETVIESILNVGDNRDAGIQNIFFSSAEIEPLGESNDNMIIVTILFTNRVTICF